jgi:transcriptional regulator with XRE-family HTH domain
MTLHWTEKGFKDYIYSIAFDFVAQLEDKMEIEDISREKLASILGITKGRVSQILNNPGNLELESIVRYARALKMKVSIVAYDDNDPENEKGPINSDIFRICWETLEKPRDFWAFQNKTRRTVANVSSVKTTVFISIQDKCLFDPKQANTYSCTGVMHNEFIKAFPFIGQSHYDNTTAYFNPLKDLIPKSAIES